MCVKFLETWGPKSCKGLHNFESIATSGLLLCAVKVVAGRRSVTYFHFRPTSRRNFKNPPRSLLFQLSRNVSAKLQIFEAIGTHTKTARGKDRNAFGAPCRKKYQPERSAARTQYAGARGYATRESDPSEARGFGSYGPPTFDCFFANGPMADAFETTNLCSGYPPSPHTCSQSFIKIGPKGRKIFGFEISISYCFLVRCLQRLSWSRVFHSSTLVK